MQKQLYAFAGDTFFTHSESLLGKAIRWAETDPGEEPSWANHTGVVIEDGWLVPPLGAENEPRAIVVEALWKTQEVEWWEAHQAEVLKGQQIRAFGPRQSLTADELKIFRAEAIKYVGDKYGYWKLGFHLADRLIFRGRKIFSSILNLDSRPICSYLAAKVNATVGRFFDGIAPQTADPDEMMDAAIAYPQFWVER